MLELPDKSILAQIKALNHDAQFLDSWQLMRGFAPPEQWLTPLARLRGASVIERVGGSKQARNLVFREWRRPEGHALAREDVFWHIQARRSAFHAWRWLQEHLPAADEPAEQQAEFLGMQAIALIKLRDFQTAGEHIARGLDSGFFKRYFQSLAAESLQAQDRRDEALAQIMAVTAAEPNYPYALSTHAELLGELGQDADALSVLKSGIELTQSPSLASQYANLLIELEDDDEAWRALELYEAWTPLRNEDEKDWLLGRRCDIASHRGDQAQALHWAEQIKLSGFYKQVAAKLRAATGPLRRLVLAVPFVRQHQSTCAPASLTSIGRFWRHEITQAELAEEICYDGTPDHKERTWAESHGWACREFKVTVTAAKALLDAGMPFVLSTYYPGGAHAQVVMGYDEFRTVLFIREPGDRHTTEFLAAEALEEQLPFGPRGFVLVPEAEAAKLAAIELPDCSVYDLTHSLNAALARHDRTTAVTTLESLQDDHASHPLRWQGELALARYDGNHAQILHGLEDLLRLHPDVVNWQTERLHAIREVHGHTAQIEALRVVCAAKDSHPIHWRMLARELHWDGRNHTEALRLLRRVNRTRLDAVAVLTFANVQWDAQQREAATQTYRLASCLDDKNEGLAMSYFRAAVWVRQTATALALLRDRFEKQGQLSGQPACSLYRALDQLNQSQQSLNVLEESLRRLPKDADHAMFVAGELALWGRAERAREILAQTPQSARAAAWHRVQARIARKEGDGAAQLLHWRAVVADSPLDSDAHRSAARLLEIQEGVPAALTHLREACARFPFQWHLHVALLDWSRDQGPEAWQNAVRELLRIDPHDAWARRELADALCADKQYADAHAELDQAALQDAGSAALHAVRAGVFVAEKRADEARAACRRALQVDIDNGYSMRTLIQQCRTQEQRVAELAFLLEQLKIQATNGDAVLEFAACARPYLSEAEMEQTLRESHAARPDLWHTGVKLAEHLRHGERHEEARGVLTTLTEQFPLLPRIWMELALTLEAQGDPAAAIQAADKVREMNPSWEWGMRTLSEMVRKSGDYARARDILEQALRHSPRDGFHHGWLAEVLWQLSEKSAALDHLTQAVEIEPGYNWAWEMLRTWGEAAGRPDASREAALRLLRERPAEARTWLIQADLLDENHELEERLAALDKAIELAPDAWAATETKARVLTLAGRYEAALKLCRNHPSQATELRIRAAWIMAKKGNDAEAVRLMDAALADDPNHVWGWQLLTDWHQQHERLEQAETACRQLVRLQPGQNIPLGYLGDLQLAQKKSSEAQATFRRALEIAPDYVFGLSKLFDLYIDAKDWAAAEMLLEQSSPHHYGIRIQARRFKLLMRQKKWPQAIAQLPLVLMEQDDNTAIFEILEEEIKDHLPRGLMKQVIETAASALRRDAVNVQTGRFYVDLCRAADRLPREAVMRLIPVESEVGSRAWSGYIYWLGDRWSSRQKNMEHLFGWIERRRFHAVLRRQREALHRSKELFGAVGYNFHLTRRYRDTVTWFADWRERREIEPYMLNNLVLAHQSLGQRPEAHAALQRGLELADHNAIKLRFHLWAALDAAIQGDTAQSAFFMDAVSPDALDNYGKKLKDLLDLALEYQPGSNQPMPFDKSRSDRVASFATYHKDNRVMRESAGDVCRLIAKKLNSWGPRWWWFQHRHQTTLKVGFAVALVMLAILTR